MRRHPPLPPATVVIPAAGEGLRLPGRVRKPFRSLGGRPVLIRTLEAFRGLGFVREVVLLLHPRDLAGFERRWSQALAGLKVRRVLAGGATRAESVARGVLASCPASALILVHDAARPLVLRSEIREVARAAASWGAAILAFPVSDTVKRTSRDGFVTNTFPREGLWLAQTPQAFRRPLILEACRRWMRGNRRKSPTDDAALLERRHPVRVVPGRRENFKLTTPRDLSLARILWNF